MSGPKISYYELNAWGRSIFNGQLHCEEQAVLCAQGIQQMLDQVLESRHEIQGQSSLMDILEDKGENLAEQRDKLKQVLIHLDTETDRYKKQLQAQMLSIPGIFGPPIRSNDTAIPVRTIPPFRFERYRDSGIRY